MQTDPENRQEGFAEEIEATSDAICEFFLARIIPIFDTHIPNLHICCFDSADFNASAETIDLSSFDILLYYGCTDLIYRAIDVPDEPIRLMAELSTKIFGSQQHYEATCRCALYFALVFSLLHEFSHVACGHLHASKFPQSSPDAAPVRLTLKEVPDDAAPAKVRFHLAGVSETDLRRMFELEADSSAYELLLSIVYDVFFAIPDVNEIFPPHTGQSDLSEEQTEGIHTLIFLACSLTVALTEVHRAKANCQSSHPSALCRMMSLCIVLLTQQVPADWKRDHVFHVATINDALERRIAQYMVPTLLRAFSFCKDCCANLLIDLKLEGLHDPPAEEFFTAFLHDFFLLMKDEKIGLLTPAARELCDIQKIRVATFDTMLAYRQANWWEA